ncbi:hypothetical protein F5880DRAFT_1506630 [Lentinula raphanica]|nr:hypothetical protein F5880DRAFT_1506630 [Lentinula raphanica]
MLSLQELEQLRTAPRPVDSPNHKTFTILYIHPDYPFPLLQPIQVPRLPSIVGPSFALGLQTVLKGSPYLPDNTEVSLGAFLCVDNAAPLPEYMSVTLCGGPFFFRGPLCNDFALCSRTADTVYHLVHGFAYVLDGHGQLRNAVDMDKWTIWNWFRSKSCNHLITPAQQYNPF